MDSSVKIYRRYAMNWCRSCVLKHLLVSHTRCDNSGTFLWTQPLGNDFHDYVVNDELEADTTFAGKTEQITDTYSLLNWATRLSTEDVMCNRGGFKGVQKELSESVEGDTTLSVIGVWRYHD